MAPPKILGICKVTGCQKDATGRHYCNRHYQLWYRYGKPESPDYDERALKRLLAKILPDAGTGCWLWQGRKAHYGHGIFAYKGKQIGAHRASWFLHGGKIPEGAMICHKCDVPACINPGHLYVGSAATNSQDAVSRNRVAHGERSGTAKLTTSDVRAIRMDSRPTTHIARDYGVSNVLVGKIKRREIWARVPGPTRPPTKYRKLTPEQVREIRLDSGRQIDIAARFGVSQVMVSAIRRGAARKDVA